MQSTTKDVSVAHNASSSNGSKELDSGSHDTLKVRKLLEKNKNHIEWDGEKFVPKSMDLVRVNLGKIRSGQVFNDLKTRASHIVASICLPVNIAPTGQSMELEAKTKEIEKLCAAKRSMALEVIAIKAKHEEVEKLCKELKEEKSAALNKLEAEKKNSSLLSTTIKELEQRIKAILCLHPSLAEKESSTFYVSSSGNRHNF